MGLYGERMTLKDCTVSSFSKANANAGMRNPSESPLQNEASQAVFLHRKPPAFLLEQAVRSLPRGGGSRVWGWRSRIKSLPSHVRPSTDDSLVCGAGPYKKLDLSLMQSLPPLSLAASPKYLRGFGINKPQGCYS